MGLRKILHLDLDAFFCAVEELRRPDLAGKAFAVGGRPEERGVVSSCSYAARMLGVHSALPMSQALRLCPELMVLPPNHAAYREQSENVMAILGEQTALVEQLSVDEAFMDLSDLPEAGEVLARVLQRSILERLKLPCSIGVATNKLLAKTATDVGKGRQHGPTPPCAIEVVTPGQEAAYLASLPVKALWGVGPKTAERLVRLNIHSIGDLARVPEAELVRQFGQTGRDLFRHARGIDDRPVAPERSEQSISRETTFERDIARPDIVRDMLRSLSEDVARTLREKDLCAGTVRLKIRWSDFTTHTRQVSLSQPTDQDGVIYQSALKLLDTIWTDGRPVRLIGVGGARLRTAAHQLTLWDTPNEKERRLLDALDILRQRFGDNAVVSGRILRKFKPGDTKR
jgi:DNA polymerase IV